MRALPACAPEIHRIRTPMKQTIEWKGVIPALTTCFKKDLSVDHEFIAKHVAWLVDSGCTGIVVGGSLGEGATLTLQEKLAIIDTCLELSGQSPHISLAPYAVTRF